MKRKYMSVAIATLFVGTGTVSAQQALPNSPAAAKADDGEKVEVVTVTALKVEKLDLPQDASAAMLGFMTTMNSLGKASITATYGK